MSRPRLLILLVASALLAGCGAESADKTRSDRLVDFSGDPPRVNALERDPADESKLLLTTNRGFFRIDPKTDAVERVKATVQTEEGDAPVGTFLELDNAPDGALVGSGHPDGKGKVPEFLGMLRSADDGKTWQVVSRLGDADLHKFVFKHDRLYAWDAVLGAIIISEDGGKTFSEHFTPRELIEDFEVDPEDPDVLMAASESRVYYSLDGGDKWRALGPYVGARLAWVKKDRLIMITKEGSVQRSEDGGRSFRALTELDGEPAVLNAITADEMDLAMSDGTIKRTTDGGETWATVFTP